MLREKLNKMTKKNIINSIRNYNIKGYSKLRKNELINHIMKPIHKPFHKMIMENLNKTTINKKPVVKKAVVKKAVVKKPVVKKAVVKKAVVKKAVVKKQVKKKPVKKQNTLYSRLQKLEKDIMDSRRDNPNNKDLTEFINKFNILVKESRSINPGEMLGGVFQLLRNEIPGQINYYKRQIREKMNKKKKVIRKKKREDPFAILDNIKYTKEQSKIIRKNMPKLSKKSLNKLQKNNEIARNIIKGLL